MVRTGKFYRNSGPNGTVSFGEWCELKGRNIVEDGERVRLAICPDVKKTVWFYEELGRSA